MVEDDVKLVVYLLMLLGQILLSIICAYACKNERKGRFGGLLILLKT